MFNRHHNFSKSWGGESQGFSLYESLVTGICMTMPAGTEGETGAEEGGSSRHSQRSSIRRPDSNRTHCRRQADRYHHAHCQHPTNGSADDQRSHGPRHAHHGDHPVRARGPAHFHPTDQSDQQHSSRYRIRPLHVPSGNVVLVWLQCLIRFSFCKKCIENEILVLVN